MCAASNGIAISCASSQRQSLFQCYFRVRHSQTKIRNIIFFPSLYPTPSRVEPCERHKMRIRSACALSKSTISFRFSCRHWAQFFWWKICCRPWRGTTHTQRTPTADTCNTFECSEIACIPRSDGNGTLWDMPNDLSIFVASLWHSIAHRNRIGWHITTCRKWWNVCDYSALAIPRCAFVSHPYRVMLSKLNFGRHQNIYMIFLRTVNWDRKV